MTSPKKTLREYIVAPAFNAASLKLDGLSHQDKIDLMNRAEKAALDAIRKPVSDLVKAEGGTIKIDGSNFAVKDHPEQNAPFMLVRMQASTAKKVGQLPGVLVSPNSRLFSS